MVYVSDLIKKATDVSGLYYRSSFERGYLVNWDVQLAVWDRIFEDSVLNCQPESSGILLTEPTFNFPEIRKNMDEIIFEEYGFKSLYRNNGSEIAAKSLNLSAFQNKRKTIPDCVMIVDIGQIDVGGLILTNFLKEMVSYRSWDMMDERYTINDVKEKCCYVTQDLSSDIKKAKFDFADIESNYVLPDFTTTKTGFVLDKNKPSSNQNIDQEQILSLKNERFLVPEILFSPSNAGMQSTLNETYYINQGGLHEAILESINACPQKMRGLLLKNIIVIGGTAKLSGLKERLETELQSCVPSEYTVQIFIPEDPSGYTWECGQLLLENIHSGKYSEIMGPKILSRKDYLEMGPDRVVNFF
ncbi:hypothetical protein BB559_003598 [Furculomyces boomerangus]|uniref:Actin-like protein ARP6 n=2 Tax=Harpellales TaxID=61421 RepID=A0A2T9YK99_9FUNG|nr:hypothetical protein BB559_003598 [Furculomyces boomerangus]PVZ96774.1 hypothetical protein BB558_007304 [Smittium angustum]PWA03036.1 hypothetical protein BB558_000821 [Smittium angustum]